MRVVLALSRRAEEAMQEAQHSQEELDHALALQLAEEGVVSTSSSEVGGPSRGTRGLLQDLQGPRKKNTLLVGSSVLVGATEKEK